MSCSCCGEDKIQFLGIDHINGRGNEHRRKIWGKKAAGNIYWWLKKNNFPKGFQVLCHNCNWGKFVNNGICPHKTSNP